MIPFTVLRTGVSQTMLIKWASENVPILSALNLESVARLAQRSNSRYIAYLVAGRWERSTQTRLVETEHI